MVGAIGAATAMTGLIPLVVTAGIVLTVSERMLQQKAARGQTVRKISKAKTRYVERSPRRQKCRTCDFFSDERCDVVSGEISPGGWCKLWAKRR